MNSNKLSKLFLAVLSSAVIMQTATFAFTPEQLEAREHLHRSVLASAEYQQAQARRKEIMDPLKEKEKAFCNKLYEVSAPFDQKIRSLESALRISRDHKDREIARLTQESNEHLALECAPLRLQLALAEAAFEKQAAPFKAKISAILQKRQERSACKSKMGAGQSAFLTSLDGLDSAMRNMAVFQDAIAALRQRYLTPLESAIESAKSKRKSVLDTQIERTTETHRELEARIMPIIQALEAERNLTQDAIRKENAAFNDEINKRSAETYAAVNKAYHLAKRKLLPQYPLLRGFEDSADRANRRKVLDDAEAFRFLEAATSPAKQQKSYVEAFYKALMRVEKLDKRPEVLDDAKDLRLLEEITSQSNERAVKQQNSAGGAAADQASAK